MEEEKKPTKTTKKKTTIDANKKEGTKEVKKATKTEKTTVKKEVAATTAKKATSTKPKTTSTKPKATNAKKTSTSSKPKTTVKKVKEEKKIEMEEIEEIKIQEEEIPKEKNTQEELEKIAEEIEKTKKLPEDKTKALNKTIFRNMIMAIFILIYGVFLILGFARIEYATYILDLRMFSIICIMVIIAIYERAYKKDSGEIAIYGIELLPLAIGTLILPNILEENYERFVPLIATVTYIYGIYYVIKSVIQYIKRKHQYLKENQDIKDIISK